MYILLKLFTDSALPALSLLLVNSISVHRRPAVHILFQSVSGKKGEMSLRTTGNLPPLPHHTGREHSVCLAVQWYSYPRGVPEESQTQDNPKVSNLERVTFPFLCEGTILFNS